MSFQNLFLLLPADNLLFIFFQSDILHIDKPLFIRYFATASSARSLFAPGGDGLRSVAVVALQARWSWWAGRAVSGFDGHELNVRL